MSISSLSSRPSTLPAGDTSSIIKEALGEEAEVTMNSPLTPRAFKDTLARLSAQHEASEEDNPESDSAYQALLTAALEQSVTPPSHQDFLTFSQHFAMPERPKTSPSKLALSVELKPVTSEDDVVTRQRARLKLLAPLELDASQEDASLDAPAQKATAPAQKASPAPREASTQPSPTAPQSDPVEVAAPELSIDSDPAQRVVASPGEGTPAPELKMPPVVVPRDPVHRVSAPAEAEVTPPPAMRDSGAMSPDGIERAQSARRVALSMQNSPLGQKLDIDIKDIFGKPLTLKIVFEDQRARATCFGSQFHDPDQLEHVLDSVRTALEASGFELGDFIMHHHRDRRPAPERPLAGEQERAQGEVEHEAPQKRDILRIVGIVNRIA